MVEQMEVGLYDHKEADDAYDHPRGGFDQRRAAQNRQRFVQHAWLVALCVLSVMTVALSIKVFLMNGDLRDLRVASLHTHAAPRPDYHGTAERFVGGYTRHGHTFDSKGARLAHLFHMSSPTMRQKHHAPRSAARILSPAPLPVY